MIWSPSFRQLMIATGLIFTLGTVNLHAEQKSDIEAVTAANLAFDTALSARDIDAMERVWAAEPYVIAVHPASKALIVGWDAVRKSWEATFGRFAEISVSMKEPQIHVAQNVAWVVGMESVQGKSKNGEAVSFMAFTTNMYEKRKGRWLMVLHTTSRVPQ
ncbi:nuclear transport factor 2 family protein [Bradyrhizobium sp. CB3481]|uniref:YybH family protein n=1 Tax=Bradyrhizobium sp. CB3481 TaxID=3039158 RepID=UPI0024B13A9E|nr:nuclear transport factor 2 family protein [Bradyrhizobium sp. CB3481]WFU19931.1 nuclear transport factor 2 family protein [Bradyrhizobium sp. CB3481]